MVVGRLLSSWESLFSGALLVFWGVHIYMSIYIYICIYIYIYFTVYIYMFVCVPVFFNISTTFRHIQPLSTQNHPRFPDASHHGGMTLRGKVPWLVHGDVYLIHSPQLRKRAVFFWRWDGGLFVYIYINTYLFIHLYTYILLYIYLLLDLFIYLFIV